MRRSWEGSVKVIFLLSLASLGLLSCKFMDNVSSRKSDSVEETLNPAFAKGTLTGTLKGQAWSLVSGSAALLDDLQSSGVNALIASTDQVGCKTWTNVKAPHFKPGNFGNMFEINVPKKVGTYKSSTPGIKYNGIRIYSETKNEPKYWEIVISKIESDRVSGSIKAEFAAAEKTKIEGNFEIFICK